MSAFSNIPPHAVLPLGTYALDELRKAARHADQTLLEVDLAGAVDRDGVFKRLAGALALPRHFGHNLDALYDCVTDLRCDDSADRPGFVVVLANIPETPAFDARARDALLDVFRDASDYFDDRKTAFRVFYSVARQPAGATSTAG